MAEAVIVNPCVVHADVEPGWGCVEQETGVPFGYSSGYVTTSSEARTPKNHPKTRISIRRVSSGGSSEEGFSRTSSIGLRSEPESTFSSPAHVHFQQHPSTGQLEQGPASAPSMGMKRQRRRMGPLHTVIKHIRGLHEVTLEQLTSADDLLCNGKTAEAIPCLEASITGCSEHPQLQSLLWLFLGNAHMAVGQYKKASVCYTHHLAYCRELQDTPSMIMAECNLGIAYLKLGFLRLAGKCFVQFLVGSQELGDDIVTARAYSNLGLLSKMLATSSYRDHMKEQDRESAKTDLQSHLKKAIGYFEHHLEIVEHHGNLDKQARAYGNLGSCYEMLHQFPQAIFCHNKRLEISRAVKNRFSESCALCNLGNCFRVTGKLREAMDYYLLSFELTRAMGNAAGERVAVLNLGTVCEQLNCPKKAIEWYTLYLACVVQSGDLRGQARGFSRLAGLYEETKQLTKAQEYYKNLVDVFHQMGDSNAQLAATQYLEEIREALRQEKLLAKGQHKHAKKKKRKGGSRKGNRAQPHTVSRASGLEAPARQHVRSSRNKRGMNSSTSSRQWYQTPPDSTDSSLTCTSSFVAENPMTHGESEEDMATQTDRIYRSPGMSQQLFEHEVSTIRHNPEEIHPLYRLEEIVGNPCSRSHMPLPEVPTDDSDTDYESVEGESQPSSHALGNKTHREELRKMSIALVEPLADLSLDGMDREWEQWLQIQADRDDIFSGSLNFDAPVTRPTALPKAFSVPNFDQDSDSDW